MILPSGEYRRLSGTHAHGFEVNGYTQFFEDGFDQVILSHRHAAADEQDVRPEALLNLSSQIWKVVHIGFKHYGSSTVLQNLPTEGERVGVSNLCANRNRIHIHRLIAGCQDGNGGTSIHLDHTLPRAGQDRSFETGNTPPGLK